MSDEYLFISDCHLDAGRPEITRALVEFLQTRARETRCLYILGDLFEVWLGDDDPADDHQMVIDSLHRLADSCEVYFIAGNRDFLLGENFARKIGMSLLQEPCILQLDRSRAVLIHGDSLCIDDHDYQAFRAMVRNPEWISGFLARPLQERRQIAAQLRDNSALAMQQKSLEIMDVNATAVADCFDEHNADVIIHGHTHRPAVHREDAGLQRIVLGDWNPGPSYLSWSQANGFRLTDARVSC
ncbi:MAG: UDP-2,3-diacylglucosamine diphosphatase [Gammaproteobacteria bacterium]|nr:UDP-2,3-diacylglucosamine diphosphatase [Gammaproteobacteria bacterium]